MTSLRVVLRLPPRDSPTAASVSTSSADEEASDDQRTPAKPTSKTKKRKSSYLVRKEALGELRDQEQALRMQVQQFRDRAQSRSLQSLLQQNRDLHVRVAQHRVTIAGVQSISSVVGSRPEASPLGDYIHLPSDPAERRSLLLSVKQRKIDDAVRFMLARTQSHDLRRRARQLEIFETDDGDHVVLDWGVTKFTQSGLTVKRVYDEAIAFVHTHEMTMADKLGVISVRESDICPDDLDLAEVRLLATHGPRLLVEKNIALFTQYVDQSELLDQPHGLILTDSVAHDDLYPYQPLTRVRKDISSIVMVLACPQRSPQTEGDVAEIAVMKWSYSRIHKSPIATDDDLDSIAREGAFFDVMVQTVRERLAWHAP